MYRSVVRKLVCPASSWMASAGALRIAKCEDATIAVSSAPVGRRVTGAEQQLRQRVRRSVGHLGDGTQENDARDGAQVRPIGERVVPKSAEFDVAQRNPVAL